MKQTLTRSLAALAIGAVLMVPSLAGAQNWHRSNQKNQWKDLAIGAGAIGLIGALSHNDTMTAVGAAGALYSLYRYDSDGNCYRRDWDGAHHRYTWVRDTARDRGRDRDRDRDGDRDRNRDKDRNRDHDRDRGRGRDHRR
ncbi:MAG TPA: hypothetical protein VG820_03705 [Fimbriimonadaceae bacterium]|nr:hypothetical protein [Fimbriimonadaceae bacterium]